MGGLLMTKRLVTIALVFILAFSITTNALAQSYSFSLDKEIVNVFWNSDGTMSLDYQFTFTNRPGAHAIDFVDVGLPNDNYPYNPISADLNVDPVTNPRDLHQPQQRLTIHHVHLVQRHHD